jgi:acyl-CoA reductase-like NAD-dependent aldehyde dehydrogenase
MLISTVSACTRKRALKNLRLNIYKRKDEILAVLAKETRRTELECFSTEYIPSRSCVDWLLRSGESFFTPIALRTHYPLSFGFRKIVQSRIPLGNVLIIATWNYPLQITFRQVLLALYAGNNVYLKPPHQSLETCRIIYELFCSVEEYRTRIHFLSHDHTLLDDVWDKMDAVVFTGSTHIGKEIAHRAAQLSIPAIIEASGYDSVIIGSQTPSDELFDHLIWALTTHSGETCIAPKILWYPRGSEERILTTLQRKLQQYIDEVVWRGYTNSSVTNVIESFLRDSYTIGCRDIIRKGDSLAVIGCPSIDELFQLSQKSLHEYGIPFAPVLVCVPYESVADTQAWLTSKFCGLMTTTLGLSRKERKEVEKLSYSSVINHDEFLLAGGIPSVAMGGSGYSGIGRSGGFEYMSQLTKTQTVVTPGLLTSLSRPRWDIFTGKDKTAKAFLERMMKRG